MNWVDLLLLIVAVVGVGAGGFLVSRSPTFWFGMALVVFKAIRPYLIRLATYLVKPLSPEDQKKLDASRRRAEEWDTFSKTSRDGSRR